MFCIAHDPERREQLQEAARRGGEGKATSRRLAKQWAELGRATGDQDLSAILKSCMFAVKDGQMTPSEANAIATLAKAAVTISNDLELADRIAKLEELVQNMPKAGMRKVV